MSFTVAIVGRPNVGKSTLFNRLTGKRAALVDDTPGVTRDRREGKAHLADLEFTAVDTAGLENAESQTLQGRMTAQTIEAVKAADAVLFVVDGKDGITQADKHFAQAIRKLQTPVILAVNKAEMKQSQATMSEAYELGFGDPVGVSAEHGDGMAELYEALASHAPKTEEAIEEMVEEDDDALPAEMPDTPLQLAIVGRPNAGKSTLANRILGEERLLTGPEAGITRDAIMVDCEFEGRKLKLVDTAGMRRKSNVTEKIEKLALADTIEALRYAHVVVLVLDANQPLEKQDNAIAALVEQEGRALVIAVNKWDTIADKPAYTKAIHERLGAVLQQSKGVAVVPVSAADGFNVRKLLLACFDAYEVWNRQIATGELNRWLEHTLSEHSPPLVKGRRIKIRYMTQKTARPPTFILFANTSDIPDHYLRYLVNSLRETFALPGVPIRIRIRKSKNPYATGKS
jgi:GTPase